MGAGQFGHDRQQRHADAGRETPDAQGAGRFGVRVEVESGGVDGRQDRDGVVGQPASGRGQPHPSADRFDELRTRLLRQGGDLLGHRRGGQPVRLGDLTHRAETRQFEQEMQASGVHRNNCPQYPNGLSMKVTWT